MTTRKGKIVRKLGKMPKYVSLGDLRLERDGFLQLYSFTMSGSPFRMEMVYRREVVAVLPVDFKNGVVYMIEQPRPVVHFVPDTPGQDGPQVAHGMPAYLAEGPRLDLSVDVPISRVLTLELPAGVIDPGETAEEAALRELREETGFAASASDLISAGNAFPSSGICAERIHLFYALVDGLRLGRPSGDGTETINVRRVPINDALALARSEAVTSLSTKYLFERLESVTPRRRGGSRDMARKRRRRARSHT